MEILIKILIKSVFFIPITIIFIVTYFLVALIMFHDWFLVDRQQLITSKRVANNVYHTYIDWIFK